METRLQFKKRVKELTKYGLEIDNFSNDKKQWRGYGERMELE